MSTQKGNNTRSRPQKHQNKSSFKNSLHDTSHRTKFINNIQVSDVCTRCKDVIEWKIKYKKYKPLTQPKKCVKCEQKTVRKAYHVMCRDCGKKLSVCTKCCQSKEIIPAPPDQEEQLKLDKELQVLLQSLSERKRRTFLRYMNKKEKDLGETSEQKKDDLVKKLNELNVKDDSEFGDLDDDDDYNDEEDVSD
ncbi:uncharacterized protein C9orf85 homolog [Onthophagus taurus]|uniref:uncharacterized protein C9orf85 homolog n=1 Tax=Onthophagus taurus TaxID=166361 RepID=UPI0039BDB9F0